jgi:uncharacterized damage-inducible protein DinB
MLLSDLVHHVRYNAWASRKCLDSARALTPEELNRNLGAAYPSVAAALGHIFMADDAWYSRITGAPRLTSGEPQSIEALERDWLPLLDRYIAMAEGLTEDGWNRVVSYRNLQGDPYENTVRHILLHLVNHDSFHRGQVSAFLRQLGHKPAWIDLMAYYREAKP